MTMMTKAPETNPRAALDQAAQHLYDAECALHVARQSRVDENGSGGVDHGHGNAVLLLGGGLHGGKVHGTWPTLADATLDHGDLAGTTDYRNVLAECLDRRFGLSASALATVFPGLALAYPGTFA